jgi:toxin YhaV
MVSFFNQQYNSLEKIAKKQRARVDKGQLTEAGYRTHPMVKQLAAVSRAIEKLVPSDPYHDDFKLRDDLKNYGRVKKKGLDNRYRLFFRAFEIDGYKVIIFLWLGFPRKEGDKNDCYSKFKKCIASSHASNSIDGLKQEYQRKFK